MLRYFIIKRLMISLFLVYITVFMLFYIYQTSNFFLIYHTKNLHILFETIKNFFPIVFFYTSPINVSIAVFITSYYLKRIKIFFVAQSFGISLGYIFMPFVITAFIISLVSVFINENFIPDSIKNLKYIEHIYKKNQSYKIGIANNFWTAKESDHEKFFLGSSLVSSNGIFYDFKLINIQNNHFKNLITAKKAILHNGFLNVEDGEIITLNPFTQTHFNSMKLSIDINKSQLSLWVKTPDEQSLKDIVKTIFIMSHEGLNIYPYLSILIFKIEFSFISFLLTCILSFYIAKSQKTLEWYKAFLWHSILFGMIIVIPYSISSKININPLYFLPLFLGLVIYSIKRLIDLQRGTWF